MRFFFGLITTLFCAQLSAAPPSLEQLASQLQLDKVVPLGVFTELDDIIADAQAKPRAPLVIGAHRAVSFDMGDGDWQDLNNGNRVWQLAIHSADAKTVSALFDVFELAEGAKLWAYSADKSDVMGPFTQADLNAAGQFWTPAVAGDTLMLELEEPAAAQSRLHIAKIDHGIKDWRNDSVQYKAVGDSGSCNVNVACAGSAHTTKINATAWLTIPGLLTTSLCSGTLLNNTSQDGTPYFLTANHCLSTALQAMSARTHWEFQASTCGGSDGNSNQIVDVQSMVATWGTSDFTLLLLEEQPPTSYSPYWAGWDRTGTNLNSGIGIHHPSGDLKKISTTTTPMQIVNGSGAIGDATNADGQYVRVSPWSTGTTEGGSSGSGLWNSDNKVVGQLSAGNASCSTSGGQDLYGWIGQSWEGGGSADSRLKDWLAPSDESVTKLDGCDHRNQNCSGGSSNTPPTPNVGTGGGGGGGGSAATLLLGGLLFGWRRLYRAAN